MNYPEILTQIKTMIFDVDGVLTNGQILLQSNGDQSRLMNIKDGFALQLAVKMGYKIIIITGGKSETVKRRLEGLGIYDVYLGAADKLEVYEEAKLTYQLTPESTLYMGDDIPDYFTMKEVGLPCCPANAVLEIKNISKYISPYNGGEGCVRDIVEKVLRAQGNWFNPVSSNEKHVW